MATILIDINGLSEQLGLAPQTIYRRRSEGADLPKAVKFGNVLRWNQDTVDAWIDAKEAA